MSFCTQMATVMRKPTAKENSNKWENNSLNMQNRPKTDDTSLLISLKQPEQKGLRPLRSVFHVLQRITILKGRIFIIDYGNKLMLP